jgi:hypothetical protein
MRRIGVTGIRGGMREYLCTPFMYKGPLCRAWPEIYWSGSAIASESPRLYRRVKGTPESTEYAIVTI